MSYIIAGISTEIGKTICSSILTEALQYDYWKPVQAGELDASDSMFVRSCLTNSKSKIHPESYRLKRATSPHYAAKQEDTEITLQWLRLPVSTNPIIVETAGGILSPLSDTLTNLDLIKQLQLPVILVSNDYLGSINHTLLSFEILRQAKVEIKGIVFSGKETASSRDIILKKTNLPLLFSIPLLKNTLPETVSDFAKKMSIELKNIL